MDSRFRGVEGFVAVLTFVATLVLGVTPASGRVVAPPSQPSAIERLVRQEDARTAELARYDAIATQNELSRILDARERSMVARAPAAATTTSIGSQAPASGDEFAWGAAALGLGAGVAAMCILLGCVTLVRSQGRPRSV